MDYDLVAKMHVNELKNYLKVCKLKISGNKNELVSCAFSTAENVVPVKTAVEVEKDLKRKYERKLKEDDRLIPYLLKIPDDWFGWMKMKEWHFGQCCYIQTYLTI